MAQCKLTPQEFISNTFSPQVAAVCSPAAENTCQKNNLTFIELLQPFCKLNAEGQIFIQHVISALYNCRFYYSFNFGA